MYIEPITRYYRGNTFHIRKANYLILMQHKDKLHLPFRACVRKVAVQQVGHFMIGYAQIGGEKIVVEGSYGCNGLAVTVDEIVFSYGIQIPQYLYDMWNKSGGWNSAGAEATQMRKWANDNLNLLTPK